MLPFLPKKHTVSVGVVSPPKDSEADAVASDTDQLALNHAASELLSAIEAKDSSRIISALRLAFVILDCEPHVEGPHKELP